MLRRRSSRGPARPAAGAVARRAAQAAAIMRPLLDRLDRLERDINLLQRQVYRGGSPAARRCRRRPATRNRRVNARCAWTRSRTRCAP